MPLIPTDLEKASAYNKAEKQKKRKIRASQSSAGKANPAELKGEAKIKADLEEQGLRDRLYEMYPGGTIAVCRRGRKRT